MKKKLSKFIIIIGVLIISSWVSVASNYKKHGFLITGSILETVSYCGGAQPSKQVIDSSRIPHKIPFAKLFVKLGEKNREDARVIEKIEADSNGNFSIHLPKGNYCLVEEWKTKPFKLPANNTNQTVDSACYRNLYNTADFKLKVTDKSICNIKLTFHRSCPNNQPCAAFKGPLHP